MINSIEQYLAALKKELSGSDRATVQDALADAEEYLRNALAVSAGAGSPPAEALAPIFEKYGSPAEVAAAYREIESRTPPALALAAPPRPAAPPPPPVPDTRPFIARFFGVYAEPRAWGSLFYLLFSLATGIVYFSWAVTGLSLSLGLLVLIIGLPIAALFLLSVRGITLVEGRMVEALIGIRMPRRPLFSPRDAGWWRKLKGLVLSGRTWTALGYLIMQMPLGVIYFTVFVTLIATSAWLIGRPLFEYTFGLPAFTTFQYAYYTPGWLMPFSVIGGVLLVTATMHLAKITARGHGLLAKALLVRE